MPIVDFAELKSISVLLIGEYLVYRLIDVLKHMKDKPDERIKILNKAFFHKKSHISFKYLYLKRKAGNSSYFLSTNKLHHIQN